MLWKHVRTTIKNGKFDHLKEINVNFFDRTVNCGICWAIFTKSITDRTLIFIAFFNGSLNLTVAATWKMHVISCRNNSLSC